MDHRLTVDTQIWSIVDYENRGLLTPVGFGMVLRLIGHAQAGAPISYQIAERRELISKRKLRERT